MTDTEQEQDSGVASWKQIAQLITGGQTDVLRAELQNVSNSDVAHILYHLSPEDRVVLLQSLDQERAASVMESMSETFAADLLSDPHPADAAGLLEAIRSDEAADILGELEEEDAVAILEQMQPEEAEETRSLSAHPEHTAGGVMITEFLAFPQDYKSADVIRDLEANATEYANYNIQYIYAVNSEDQLQGVIRLRDLIFRNRTEVVSSFMISDPRRVKVDASLEDLQHFFDDFNLMAVPVVDYASKLVGIVRRADVEEAEVERATEENLRRQGIVGGDELRTMPVWLRSGRRVSWLSVNIILNIISASVIALYQDTLEAAITLAVFLPIISDMSGCSGNQAVAVSLRELSLGLVKHSEISWVLFKEISVGLINGIILGVLIAGAAYLWQGNVYLGLVVGLALSINTLIAVSIGGVIPLILRRFKIDPAIASGPLLTTITDMSGFLLLLSLATACLTSLV